MSLSTVGAARSAAFKQQLQSGKYATNIGVALNTIKNNQNGIIIPDLLQKTGLMHQTLTSVLSKLEDLGLIYVGGTTKLANNITYSIFFASKNNREINKWKKKRMEHKYKQWLKRGEQFLALNPNLAAILN